MTPHAVSPSAARLSALLPVALSLAACGPVATREGAVVIAPVDTPAPKTVTLAPDGLEPAPRPGMTMRFLALAPSGSAGSPVRVAMDVPASWGVRARSAGGRALRPCKMSPSSPSELFVQTRPACDSGTCADSEKLDSDLIRAGLIYPDAVTSKKTEALAGTGQITRITGYYGSRPFSAFRFVRVDTDSRVPVACEAFFVEDEVEWTVPFETACSTLRISPSLFRDEADEIAPAPDGAARSPSEEAVTQTVLGFVSALAARDATTAATLLFTASECVASGGPSDDCQDGALDRRGELRLGLERIPLDFVPGAVDVRFPPEWKGLARATVKRRGDPCGPGYELTLAQAASRYAVISADPMPDPRLLQ